VSSHLTFTNTAHLAQHVTDTAESANPAQGLFQAEEVALASAAGAAAREVMRKTAMKARRAVGKGVTVPLKHFRRLTPTEMLQQAGEQEDGFLALHPVSGSIKMGTKSARAIENSKDFLETVKHWKRYVGTVFPTTLLHMQEDLDRVERWTRWSGWEAARDWVELERSLHGDTVWLKNPKDQSLENLQLAMFSGRQTGTGRGQGGGGGLGSKQRQPTEKTDVVATCYDKGLCVAFNRGTCGEAREHEITKADGTKLTLKHACTKCGRGNHGYVSCPSK
jgi:hypothetical protein